MYCFNVLIIKEKMFPFSAPSICSIPWNDYKETISMKMLALSKFMSKILRHRPDLIAVTLDSDGSCDFEEFVNGIMAQGKWSGVTKEDILAVVYVDDKERFRIENGRIKCNYGHSSIKVDYQAKTPPDQLIHGTSLALWEKIKIDGLRPMKRKYVHMSESPEFAALAGKRKSKDSGLVLLHVHALQAHRAGVVFYQSDNGVWLAENVPAHFLAES
jgi:putative RNA 2'-phosphotransferase